MVAGLVMDVMDLKFADSSFEVVIDKGGCLVSLNGQVLWTLCWYFWCPCWAQA